MVFAAFSAVLLPPRDHSGASYPSKMPNSEASISVSSDDSSRPWQSYHTAYTNAKAGMEGVDKERVQRVVYEMSKGSKYFENEERKEAYMKQKIENMSVQCAKLTADQISHYQKVSDKRIIELEATRDLSRIWLHVDMDAFYAAVETLCNPSLEGKPMAVGSMSMISTANYEARKFGVRAAMPGFIARKLCPELIFVPTDFKKYNHYSDLTRKVFEIYDPNFVASSLDEAYLDITNVCKARGMTCEEVTKELRANVIEETGLTCSAGVAPNRLLAKVCSDINKPNGQFVLPNNRDAVMTFISSLPVRKIGGIGKVTEHILKDVFGIKTCEDMLQNSSMLCALFSQSSADFFLCVGLGIGGTDTPQVGTRKSISNERTFSETKDVTLIYQKLVDLAEMLSADMEKEGLYGRTLTLKLKTSSFEVRTRAVTLPNFIRSSEDILKHASKLLKAELPVSLRLMGLRMSHLSEEKDGVCSDPTQKTLSNFFVPGDASPRKMERLDNCDTSFSIDMGTDFPAESNDGYCDLGASRNRDLIVDANHSDCMLVNHEETETSFKNQIDELCYKVDHPNIAEHTMNRCEQEEASVNRWKDRVNHVDEAASSSNQNELVNWVDDYKCSLCGVELPPNFIEERQEHSDFHLAERLQDEESGSQYLTPNKKNNLFSCLPHHRSIKQDHTGSQHRQRKKQKSSPAQPKHIPIDAFFIKKQQDS